MRWTVPRELLWAIIITLTVAVIAIWPSCYPYKQIPQVSQVDPGSEQKHQSANEHVTEITILGVKPGEWLLSIVTLMLWAATVRLVRGAEKTAEQQLRAYVSIETGSSFRQSHRLHFEFRANVINNGNTPAKDVRIISNVGVVAPLIPDDFNYTLPPPFGGSVSTIGPKQSRFHSVVLNRRLSFAERRQIVRGALIFHIYGAVHYLDIFDKRRQTNFSIIIFIGKKRETPIWHFTERNNDST